MADYHEWGVGPMPGEVILLRLMQWTGVYDPGWYLDKDIERMVRLMRLERVSELAAMASSEQGMKNMSPTDQLAYHWLDKLREQDDRYHGPLGVTEDDGDG